MVEGEKYMFLKKELFHIPFSKYNEFSFEYEDINDLKYGILNLCYLLKKDIFLIQVFEKETSYE